MVQGRTIPVLNRVLEVCLCGLIFFVPFSKAGVEIWLHLAFFAWLIKRCLIGRSLFKSSGVTLDFFRPFRVIPTQLNKPIFLLAILSFLSAVFSIYIGLSFEGIFGKLYTHFFIFFLTLEVITRYNPAVATSKEIAVVPKVLYRILGIFLFSVSLIICDGIFQKITGRDFMRGFAANGYRLRASFGNPNDYAGWIIAVLPLLLSLVFVEGKLLWSRRRKMIKTFLLLLSGLALFDLGATYSRGAWVGFLVSLSLAAVFGIISKKRKLLYVSVAVLTVIGLSAISVFLIRPVRQRALTLREGFDEAAYKQYGWREAIHIIEDFPLLGIGPNNYADVGIHYRIKPIGGAYPHNCYLHMAAEIGLLGLFAFLWIIGRFFRLSILKVSKAGSPLLFGITAGLLAFLVHSFFDTNLFTLQLIAFFWFLLALGTSLILAPKSVCEISSL